MIRYYNTSTVRTLLMAPVHVSMNSKGVIVLTVRVLYTHHIKIKGRGRINGLSYHIIKISACPDYIILITNKY